MKNTDLEYLSTYFVTDITGTAHVHMSNWFHSSKSHVLIIGANPGQPTLLTPMTDGNEPDHRTIYDLILKEYAFDKAFRKLYESNHLCCGYKHKEFAGNIVSNIKCFKCGKYAPSKRFTSHMDRCMKK